MDDAAKMTREQAREQIENDPDVGSWILYAVSVLEEAAILEERERCAQIAEDPKTQSYLAGELSSSDVRDSIASAIREGAPAQPDGGKDADSYKHLPPRGNA